MGTLAVTYDGTTKNFTMTCAPVVAYGGETLMSAGSWEGDKVIKCGGKWMLTDVILGERTLRTKHTVAKSDIKLTYTKLADVVVQTFTVGGVGTIPSGGYSRAQFFLVGAGGYGGGYTQKQTNDTADGTNYYQSIGGGGGGGYTLTTPEIDISNTTSFTVTVGTSVTPSSANYLPTGNPSTVTINGVTYTANGGNSGESVYGSNTWTLTGWICHWGATGNGGAGGCGGGGIGYNYAGNGGSDGGNGTQGHHNDARQDKYYADYMKEAVGQGTSTLCNWTGADIYYAGGGGGARYYQNYSGNAALSKGGIGGTSGGGNGYAQYDGSKRYPTAGANGTGGGGGGNTQFAEKGELSRWVVNGCAGGSGVVIAKFWEA